MAGADAGIDCAVSCNQRLRDNLAAKDALIGLILRALPAKQINLELL